MFKRKYHALLMSPESAPYDEYRRVTYTIEGPRRRRLVDYGGDDVLLLRDDGSVGGSTRFAWWEQL
jgi:hypothetical protein